MTLSLLFFYVWITIGGLIARYIYEPHEPINMSKWKSIFIRSVIVFCWPIWILIDSVFVDHV